jgi:hypothetical protein
MKSAFFFFSQSHRNPIKIRVVTDVIDPETERLFRYEIDQHLSAFKDERSTVTGFDRASKKLVQYTHMAKVTCAGDQFGYLADISYELMVDDGPMTLAADVLVNSVFYHLKKMIAEKPGIRLNSEEAICGHPLSALAWGYVPKGPNVHIDSCDEYYGRHWDGITNRST